MLQGFLCPRFILEMSFAYVYICAVIFPFVLLVAQPQRFYVPHKVPKRWKILNKFKSYLTLAFGENIILSAMWHFSIKCFLLLTIKNLARSKEEKTVFWRKLSDTLWWLLPPRLGFFSSKQSNLLEQWLINDGLMRKQSGNYRGSWKLKICLIQRKAFSYIFKLPSQLWNSFRFNSSHLINLWPKNFSYHLLLSHRSVKSFETKLTKLSQTNLSIFVLLPFTVVFLNDPGTCLFW